MTATPDPSSYAAGLRDAAAMLDVDRQAIRLHANQTTSTDRRQRVIALLSNVDTARLPDREIARRVGVSP